MKREYKLALIVYVVCLGAYCATAGSRLLTHSSDIHFSYQAQMFRQRRLDLGHPPPSSNDWAEVKYLHLKDGRTIAGAYLRSMPNHFRKLDGTVESVTDQQIQNSWTKYYVSFPPFPSLIFL